MTSRFVKRSVDENIVKQLMELGVNCDYSHVMASRGINAENYNEHFGDVSKYIHDPFDMVNMAEAVETIEQVIEAEGSILIFGDYDADGLTGSSILSLYFDSIGVANKVLLPNRADGYGLNTELIFNEYENEWFDLIITVDCGISNCKEIAELYEHFEGSVEIIVTDHHELPEILPDCICVNPKLGYHFKYLSGSGVAYKVVSALSGNGSNYLELALLGTVADSMPLVDENRAIVSLGLANFKHKGLLKLAELSKCGKKLTAYDIGMRIAPKINAAGRVDSPFVALPLLLSDKKADVVTAQKLISLNDKRREINDKVSASALEMCRNGDSNDKLIFAYNDNWPHGVLGIVASRLREQFGVPTFILTRDGDNYVGSARGGSGDNLVGLLEQCREHLVKYGGHSASAGLTVKASEVENLFNALKDKCQSVTSATAVEYDIDVQSSANVRELVEFSDRLQPLQPNDGVVFHSTTNVINASLFGKEKNHVTMQLANGIDAKAFFNYVPFIDALKSGAEIDVIYTLGRDDYNGGFVAIVKDMQIVNSLNFDSLYTLNYINNADLSNNSQLLALDEAIEKLKKPNTLVLVDSQQQLELLGKITDVSKFDIDYFSRTVGYGNAIVVSLCDDNLINSYENIVAFVSSSAIVRKYPQKVTVSLLEEETLLSEIVVNRDICADVYKALKQMSSFDTVDELYIKYLTGKVSKMQYCACLQIFRQLGIVIDGQFGIEINGKVKVQLEDSSIYRQLVK